MKLADQVRSRLVANKSQATQEGVVAALRDEGIVLGDGAILSLITELQREFTGVGILEPLLQQAHVTDILVNGPSQIWIDRGFGLERVPLTFGSDQEVRALAQRLASAAGRRLDDAHPFIDVRMESGIRLHAAIPPIALDGTSISLRLPRKQPFSLDELVAHGAITEKGSYWLKTLIESRLAFLISGGTGSGKTTVLSALLGLVPHSERIVIVEDSAELNPAHPHVVRLQSRIANLEGAGAIAMRDLVRQTLRMRPDRIVVGEVRGAEVVELLSALNTGHEGGCGTVHANSARDVPARIEALGLSAGLDRTAVHALLGAGLNAVVHLERTRDGSRVVQGIYVGRMNEHRELELVPALERVGTSYLEYPELAVLRDKAARV